MRSRIPKKVQLYAVLALLAANAFVLFDMLQQDAPPALTVSFLDVGQGDAILVEGPTGIQMLIDGGKDRSVLRALPRVMGPLDRSIDVVVATHPDADHIGGLPDVLDRYEVKHLVLTGRSGGSSIVARLADAAGREDGLSHILARAGMRLHLGGGAYADVLHPEDNVTQIRETNDSSVVLRVVYGETAFLFTGDAAVWVEDRLVARYGDALQSDVLKAGHHGSKTSTGAVLLEAVRPETVVVSAGRDNSYGHPHQEVVANIRNAGAALLATYDAGTLTFVSDGVTVEEK